MQERKTAVTVEEAEAMMLPPKYEFTYDDFLNSDKPYETLYTYFSIPTVMNREVIKMADRAKEVGFKHFKSLWKDFLSIKEQARKQQLSIVPNQTQFDEQLLELSCGEWEASDFGIYRKDKFGAMEYACTHPIMPVERLVNIDTGEVKLKLAYKRPGRDKKWQFIIVSKDVASDPKALNKALSAVGISVNQKSAPILMEYLTEIEDKNYDAIPESKSIGRLGYIEGEGFSPFVENLVFDGDASFRHLYATVKEHGSQTEWYELALKCRKMSVTARIFLAASFASPLLSVVGALPFFVHAWGGTGTGKAQPLDTKIITPNGYKLMGDLQIGDLVIGSDGKAHPIIGIYPQGEKEIYRLTFSDGTSTRCCKEHLWTVSTTTRREHGRGYTVLSLEEMLKRPIKSKKGYTYRIPITEPVEYQPNDDLPIEPYLLGALIGDGCLTLKRNLANRSTNIYFSNMEEDIVAKVDGLLGNVGCSLRRNRATQCQYVVVGEGKRKLIDNIRLLGLNVKSKNRFIPKEYMVSSTADRRKLLAGLFDTDGCVRKNGSFSYSTKSEQLANNVSNLSRSLGYRVVVKTSGRSEYSVNIFTDDAIYSSNKHKARHELFLKKRIRAEDKKSLAIVNVELVGSAKCQCIMVDSAEHTYLCDDFIVTHNTVALMLAASVWGDPLKGKFLQTFNATRVGQEMTASFLNHLPMCIDELQLTKNGKGQSNFDVYQLAEGVGRTRGKKSGGVELTPTWDCCFLTTGEDPVIGSSSGGGAVNRVIEIECFDGQNVIDDAPRIANALKKHYGWAGRMFVDKLYESDERLDQVRDIYQMFVSGLNENDTTEKQALAAAAILTADMCATAWIFQDDNALTVDEIKQFLASREAVSAGARAYSWICNWVAENENHFYHNETQPTGSVYGGYDDVYAYINPKTLREALNDANFNYTATMSYLRTNKLIETKNDKEFTKSKRVGGGRSTGYVWLRLPSETDDFDDCGDEIL